MKTLVFHMDDGKWEKIASFHGVYAKNLVQNQEGMDVTNKFIKIIPGGEISIHTHKVTEAIYILKGNPIVLVNGEHEKLPAKTMVVAPSGIEHSIKNDTQEDVLLVCNFGIEKR